MSFVIYRDTCFVRDNFVLLCSQVHCYGFCGKALLLYFLTNIVSDNIRFAVVLY